MDSKLFFLICNGLLILSIGHADNTDELRQIRRKRSSSLSSEDSSDYTRERKIFAGSKKRGKDSSELDFTVEEMARLMKQLKRRKKTKKYNDKSELYSERERKIGKIIQRSKNVVKKPNDDISQKRKKTYRRRLDSDSSDKTYSKEYSSESDSTKKKVGGKRKEGTKRKRKEDSSESDSTDKEDSSESDWTESEVSRRRKNENKRKRKGYSSESDSTEYEVSGRRKKENKRKRKGQSSESDSTEYEKSGRRKEETKRKRKEHSSGSDSTEYEISGRRKEITKRKRKEDSVESDSTEQKVGGRRKDKIKRKPKEDSLESDSEEPKVGSGRKEETKKKRKEHSSESDSAEQKVGGRRKEETKKTPKEHSLESNSTEHQVSGKRDEKSKTLSSGKELAAIGEYKKVKWDKKFIPQTSSEEKVMKEYEELKEKLTNKHEAAGSSYTDNPADGVEDYAIDFWESSTTLPREIMMITDYEELHARLGRRFATYLDLHNRDRALALSKMMCETTLEYGQKPVHTETTPTHDADESGRYTPPRFRGSTFRDKRNGKTTKRFREFPNEEPKRRTQPQTIERKNQELKITPRTTLATESDHEYIFKDEQAFEKHLKSDSREPDSIKLEKETSKTIAKTPRTILPVDQYFSKHDKLFRKGLELDSHDTESIIQEMEKLKAITKTTRTTLSVDQYFSKHDKLFRQGLELDSHDTDSVIQEIEKLKAITKTTRTTLSVDQYFSKHDKLFKKGLGLDSQAPDSNEDESEQFNDIHGTPEGENPEHSIMPHEDAVDQQYTEGAKYEASPKKTTQDYSTLHHQKYAPNIEQELKNLTLPTAADIVAALPLCEEFGEQKNQKYPNKEERSKMFKEFQEDVLVEYRYLKGPKIKEDKLDPISKKHVYSHPYYKAKITGLELKQRQRNEKEQYRRAKRQIHQYCGQNKETELDRSQMCNPTKITRKIKDQTILEYLEGLSTEERKNVENIYDQYMSDSILEPILNQTDSSQNH